MKPPPTTTTCGSPPPACFTPSADAPRGVTAIVRLGGDRQHASITDEVWGIHYTVTRVPW
jgi:hypothetical protein